MQARTSQKGSLTAESTEEEGPPLYRRLDGGLDGLDGLDGENRRRADDVHEKKGAWGDSGDGSDGEDHDRDH